MKKAIQNYRKKLWYHCVQADCREANPYLTHRVGCEVGLRVGHRRNADMTWHLYYHETKAEAEWIELDILC